MNKIIRGFNDWFTQDFDPSKVTVILEEDGGVVARVSYVEFLAHFQKLANLTPYKENKK